MLLNIAVGVLRTSGGILEWFGSSDNTRDYQTKTIKNQQVKT